MISLRTHSVLDYLVGAVLVFCPYLFGFSSIDPARNVFLALGFGLIGYSLCTNYQYSVAKFISVQTHMMLDVILGLVLALSPYIFGYTDFITGGQLTLHFVMGISTIGLVVFTERRKKPEIVSEEQPSYRRAA